MKTTRLLRFGPLVLTHRMTGVGLVLTRQCNLSCAYCQVIRCSSRGNLTPDEWCRVVDRFVQHRHRHFVLTGGEPLLYDGVHDVIRHASRKAVVSLITNGTLLDRQMLRSLRDVDFLTISFDAVTGGASGKDLTSSIDLLQEASRDFGYTIQTITTITRSNVETVPKVVEASLNAGFDALLSVVHEGCVRIGTDGGFRRPDGNLSPTGDIEMEKVRWMVDRLLELQHRHTNLVESRAFIQGIPGYLEGKFHMDCHAGEGYFEVDTDGRIMACHDVPASEVSGLTFEDYDDMCRQVRATVPAGCTCYFDCFFNHAERTRHPLRSVASLARRHLVGPLLRRVR